MTDSAAQAAEDAAAAANHAAIVAPANTGTAFTIPSNTPVFTQGGANGAIDYNAERTYIMGNMGYDPLGQLSPSATAQPGSANYGLSREYYTLNPDSEFNSLTAQYATQHSNILTESSGAAGVNGVTGQTNYTAPAVYDTSSAAGIAAMLAGISGGVPQTTSSLIDIARTEGYTGPALVTSGISTMPTITSVDRATLAQGAALTLPESALTGGTLTLYGPGIGAMNTAHREGVKVAVSPLTGEISEYTLDPWGNYGLIGGASRYAAQSGEFSVAKYNDTNTKQIWNLNLDTISPFYTENLSKSEAPGADIPWHVSSDASALMLMDQTGIYGSVTVPSVTIPSTASTTTKGYDFSQGTFTPVTEKDLTGGGGFGALAADNFPGVSLGFITLGETAKTGNEESTLPAISSSKSSDLLTTIGNDVQAWAGLGVSAFDVTTSMIGLGTPGKNLYSSGPDAATNYETSVKELTDQWTLQQQTLAQDNAALTAFETGKVANGQWIGSATDYATYKGMLSDYNSKVSDTNELSTRLQSLQSDAIQSGLLIQQPGGSYAINPEKDSSYGQFSLWSQGASKIMQEITNTSPEKFAAYEQTPDYTTQNWYSPITNVLYGTFKQEVLNPGQVASYAVVGAGGAIAAEATLPIAEEYLAGVAGGEGLSAMAARTSLAIGGSSLFQGALFAVPAALSIGSASDWGKNTAQQTEVNIGGMLPNLAGMVIGGGGPAGYARASDIYTERMSTTQILNTQIDYVARPDVSVSSGVGGSIRYTESANTLAPTTFNIMGREINLPRIFTPSPVVTTVTLENVDVGSLLGARLEGAEASPIVGSRVVTSTLSYAPGDEVATGLGELRIGEVKLPQTFREYMEMAKSDAKLTGQSQDELAASYMRDATNVAIPRTGIRQLDVAVNIGTDIRDAFNWNFNRATGTDLALNRINLEDYVGRLSIERTGGGSSDYTVNIIKDVGETRFQETGNVEITGAQTPESKIVSQLQEVSRNMEKNDVEHMFSFDTRGNLVHEEMGLQSEIPQTVVNRAYESVGGESHPSFAHSHPSESISRTLTRTDLTPLEKVRFIFNQIQLLRLPSITDISAYSQHSSEVAAEYISSPAGVTVFRGDLGQLEPLSEVTRGSEGNMPLNVIREFGVDVDFIPADRPYVSASYTARTAAASEEMAYHIPADVRAQFADVIDRIVLDNPNLEFERQATTPEPSLSQSGSNLGTGRGGGSYGSPLAPRTASLVQMERDVSDTIVSSDIHSNIPEAGSPSRSAETALKSTDIVTVSRQSDSIIEPQVAAMRAVDADYGAAFSVGSMASLMQGPSQKSEQDYITAFTPASTSILGQSQEQKRGLDYVTAFDVASIAASRIGSDQAQFLDYVTAFDIASTTELKTEQTPDQTIDQVPAYLQTPELTTDQIVTPVQIPAILQIPDVVVTQIPPPAIPIPPPAIPIPAPYTFSGFGGSSVSKTWRKRIQLEIFGMGTDTRAVRALGINVPLPVSPQIAQRIPAARNKSSEVNKGQNNIYGNNQRGQMFTMPSVRIPSRRKR